MGFPMGNVNVKNQQCRISLWIVSFAIRSMSNLEELRLCPLPLFSTPLSHVTKPCVARNTHDYIALPTLGLKGSVSV